MMVSHQTLNIQVFNADDVIFSYKRNRTLMQVISTAVGNLLVKSGNFESLAFISSAPLLFARKMSLCMSEPAFVFLRVVVIIESFFFRSGEKVLQS